MNKVLTVQNLSFSYPNCDEVLQNISFSVDKGSVVTILGQNGTGKTTLLNCILGFLNNYSGNILVMGKPVQSYTRRELASLLAFVPQLSSVQFDYTVREFVLMGFSSQIGIFSVPDKKMHKQVDETLESLGLSHLSDRSIRTLSGGELQLTYIARALSQNPQIIVLDEPTSALDYAKGYMVLKLVKKLQKDGYTIILTCHNPDYAFYFMDNTAAFLRNGEFCFGKTESILTDALLSQIYGIDMKIIALPEYNQRICLHIDKGDLPLLRTF